MIKFSEAPHQYNFREDQEINLTFWHNAPYFNQCLFTVLAKSKIPFRCHFEITRPAATALQHDLCLLDKEPSLHLSFNKDAIKNYVKEISRTLSKKIWQFGAIYRYFLSFHNGRETYLCIQAKNIGFLFFKLCCQNMFIRTEKFKELWNQLFLSL